MSSHKNSKDLASKSPEQQLALDLIVNPMSAYFADNKGVIREWQSEVRSFYNKTCEQHLMLFHRYRRLPKYLRDSDKIGTQISEDIGEFSNCGEYADTFWAGLLALLGSKFEGNDVASCSDLQMIEDFVGRAQEAIKKLGKAVAKLETYV